MQLYNPDTTPLIDIQVDDSSYAYNTVMGRDDLTLNFALNRFIELPLGVYCLFLNRKYSLTNDSNFKMVNTQNFTYQLLLDAPIAYAKQTKFKFVTLDKNPDGSVELNTNPKIKFSLTGRPVDFLNLWVDCMNLNDKEGGWTVGECLESEEVTLDFNNQWCYDVLADFAGAFDTEWEADGKTMHLRRVEKMKDNPLPLSYGMGNGLLSGLERKVSKAPVSRVWIETSERNIDSSVYGSDTLRMKKNQTIVYKGIEYVTDPTGSYLERKEPLIVANIVPEDSLDLTKIYPSHVGTVSSVEVINDEKGVYAIVDTSNMINYRDVVIAGEKATLIFQSGQLTGKEFEFNYNHTLRRFQLNPINENGLLYPHGTLIPEAGDKYAVFHISLPQEYIDEAEEKTLNETVKYLYENEPPKYLYTAPVSELYAKRNWGLIGDRLNTGYFVHLSDNRFLPEGEDIRIVEVTRYVNKPMQPKIGLSGDVVGVRLGSELNKISNQKQTIDRKQKDAINYAKRGWADTQQLTEAVKGMVDDFENSELSAEAFKGMIGLFGSENLQFQFLDIDWVTAINPFISFDPKTKQLTCHTARIQHMTLGIDAVQPGRSISDYKFWLAPDYRSPVLTESSEPYFLYLKTSKTFQETGGRNTGEATFFISTEKIKLDDIEGYYTLWVGYLNSENMEGDRSFRTMYGYTEVLPGQITVDKLLSTSGALVIDLLNGVISAKNGATIQGNIKFISNNGDYQDVGDEFDKTNEKINNIQIGNRNYVLNSKEIQLNAGASPYIFYPLLLSEGLQSNTEYTFSIEKTEITSGTAVPVFSVIAYNTNTDQGVDFGFQVPVSLDKQTATFKTATLPNDGFTLILYAGVPGSASNRAMKWTEVKLAKGNKASDWSLAPEDIQKEINKAQNTADNAQVAANDATQSVTNLNTYVDGAFKDGVIDNAEAQAIEKYLNTIDETMSQVEATYNKLYINPYLEGDTKISLLNAKINLFGARDNLKASINNAIADGIATPAEKADVDSKFAIFNSDLKAFQNAVEDANKAIQSKLDSLSTEKINNIQIGNRNYVLNSKEIQLNAGASPYIFYPLLLSEGLQSNTEYTFSIEKTEITSGTAVPVFSVIAYNTNTDQGVDFGFQVPVSLDKQTATFKTATLPNDGFTLILYAGVPGSASNRAMKWTEVKLAKGNKASDWSLAPEDIQAEITALEYLKTALANRTEIDGGLLLTSLFKLGTFSGNSFTDKAGINGTATGANDVVAWFGGTLQQAIQNLASIVFRMDGSGQLAKGNISWDTTGSTRVKGRFESSNESTRIVIDPESKEFQFYLNNFLTGKIYIHTNENNESSACFESYYRDDAGYETKVRVTANGISMYNNNVQIFSVRPSVLSGKVALKAILPNQSQTVYVQSNECYTDSNGNVKLKI